MNMGRNLTKIQIAWVLEIYTNNPHLTLEKIGEMFNVSGCCISLVLSKNLFYKMPSSTTKTLVYTSKMDEVSDDEHNYSPIDKAAA